ncbi:hypothetical protein [Sphingomonas melonis]|uniref:hypothetical protein n=1 Tax=Sphingomonas melonis TaxID=152682 RepID=UPI0035C7CB7F
MALKIADLMEAAKRLRLRKGVVKFRPRLVYLVETSTGYTHPKRMGYTSGQTAWSDPSLWFQCHKDADTIPAWEKPKVIKLNVCAFEEPIIRSNSPPASTEQADDT